jgi:hypothetical protein
MGWTRWLGGCGGLIVTLSLLAAPVLGAGYPYPTGAAGATGAAGSGTPTGAAGGGEADGGGTPAGSGGCSVAGGGEVGAFAVGGTFVIAALRRAGRRDRKRRSRESRV